LERRHFIYVLRSLRNGWLYVGMTRDIARRLGEHNRGHNRSTKGKGPFELLHSEAFASRAEARERERQLKSGAGREWIKAVICRQAEGLTG
jgi:putative endonuclease